MTIVTSCGRIGKNLAWMRLGGIRSLQTQITTPHTRTELSLSSLSQSPQSITLPNHLHIVCGERQLPAVAICWKIPAGSCFEDEFTVGASHYVRHGLLMGNMSESANALSRKMELRGASLQIKGDREYISIELDCPVNALESAVESVVHMVEGFKVEEWQMAEVQGRVDMDGQLAKADPATILFTTAMEIAYRNGLGYSPVNTCPPSSSTHMTPRTLRAFWEASLQRSGHVMGVDGVRLGDIREIIQNRLLTVHTPKLNAEPVAFATYYGGECRIPHAGPQNHVMVAFGTVPGEEARAGELLAGLIGGKSRIPFGGANTSGSTTLLPTLGEQLKGKEDDSSNGVYLQAQHWSWERGGLLTVHLATHSTTIPTKPFIEALCRDLRALFNGQVSSEMLMTGKARVASQLAWECEGRLGYARQLAFRSTLEKAFSLPDELRLIENMSNGEFQGLTSRILARKPVYIAMGNLRQVPHADEILF